MVVTSPRLISLMVKPLRRMPILIRREWGDDDTSPAVQEKEFDAELTEFIGHIDIKHVQGMVR
jgi:hypothetical protein